MTLIIQKPTGAKLVLAQTSVAPLLLDSYSGAAAAYSLRSLSLAYGGSVVRVRRSSDNTEFDFTAAQVSDGSLIAWVGAGNNGFVRTWYDQSGNNRHAQQTTSAQQPQIVSSGTLVTDLSKPALAFNGNTGSRFLSISNSGVTKTNLSVFIIAKATNYASTYPNAAGFVSQQTATGSWLLDAREGGVGQGRAGSPANISVAVTNEGPYLIAASQVGTTVNFAVNSGSTSTNASSLTNYNTDDTIILGRISATEDRLDGSMQEVIFYWSDQTANRTAIESNINAHYAIY
jgi:hypothetical protein